MLWAGFRDWPWWSGRRRAENAPQSGMSTVVLGAQEATQPGRSSCVRNAVTPSGNQSVGLGEPTVRRADPLGGCGMTEKRMPAAETRRETMESWVPVSNWSSWITGRVAPGPGGSA